MSILKVKTVVCIQSQEIERHYNDSQLTSNDQLDLNVTRLLYLVQEVVSNFTKEAVQIVLIAVKSERQYQHTSGGVKLLTVQRILCHFIEVCNCKEWSFDHRGSYTFNLLWTILFPHEFIFSEIRNLMFYRDFTFTMSLIYV